MENKQCENCGNVFQHEPNPSFPRKYCPSCSAVKKANWEQKKMGAVPMANPPVFQNNTAVVSNEPSRGNSIVAQNLTNRATDVTMAFNPNGFENFEDLGAYLDGALNEVVGTYNKAISLLQNG